EPGIRATSAGNSPHRLNQAARQTAATRAPRAGLGRWLAEPTQQPAAAGHDALPRGMPASPDPHCRKESHHGHTGACRFGHPGRVIGAPRRLRGTVMPGADEAGNRRERDKLTIAEVCADLGISRRTFYEWRSEESARACAPHHHATP